MLTSADASPVDEVPDELADELMARHVEVQTLADLMGNENQRGTPIPALFNTFYKFIQNPSTVSAETLKRMVDTDETVGSGVDFLASCLCARMGAYQHPLPEVTKFVTKALDNIEGGFYNATKELQSAAWAGFAVDEIEWANLSWGFAPARLAPLPPSTVLFETSRTGVITDDGILQYQRNYNPISLGNGIGFLAGVGSGFLNGGGRPDPMAKFGDLPFPLRTANTFNYMSVRIPKLKCIHFAWNSSGQFGNPYGRSMLRRAYNWWVQKWAYAQMLGIALDRKGTPLTIVYADPNASIVAQNKYDSRAGATRADTEKAPAAAARAFKNIHNDTTIVLPGKKGSTFDVDMMPQTPNTADFLEAIKHADRSIMRAILIPALVFTSGDGSGSYSLGQEHAKTFDKLLDGYLEGFKRTMIDQLVRQIVAYNFPKAMWEEHGLGSFAKRELTTDERQKEAEMFQTAVNMGVVDVNDLGDLNKMREAMGFEPRDKPIEKPEPVLGIDNGEIDEDGETVQSTGEDGAAKET